MSVVDYFQQNRQAYRVTRLAKTQTRGVNSARSRNGEYFARGVHPLSWMADVVRGSLILCFRVGICFGGHSGCEMHVAPAPALINVAGTGKSVLVVVSSNQEVLTVGVTFSKMHEYKYKHSRFHTVVTQYKSFLCSLYT